MTDPFPEQDLSILTSPVSRRTIQRLSRLADTPTDTYTALHLDRPTALVAWDRALDIDGQNRRLAAFALICFRLLWTTRNPASASRLDAFLEADGCRTLIDSLPALARLHERLHYTDILIAYLRNALVWITDGELAWAAQEAFIAGLQAEFQRRRAAWKAALTARLPATRETLVSTVWHPRNLERWLNTATTEAARDHIFNGFVVEN